MPFSRLGQILNRRFVKFGLPFLICIIGGSFGLKEFAKLRYEFSKISTIKPADAEKYGVRMKKPGEVTLESEYEKVKKVDIDNWEQVRGPRPWEEETMTANKNQPTGAQ